MSCSSLVVVAEHEALLLARPRLGCWRCFGHIHVAIRRFRRACRRRVIRRRCRRSLVLLLRILLTLGVCLGLIIVACCSVQPLLDRLLVNTLSRLILIAGRLHKILRQELLVGLGLPARGFRIGESSLNFCLILFRIVFLDEGVFVLLLAAFGAWLLWLLLLTLLCPWRGRVDSFSALFVLILNETIVLVLLCTTGPLDGHLNHSQPALLHLLLEFLCNASFCLLFFLSSAALLILLLLNAQFEDIAFLGLLLHKLPPLLLRNTSAVPHRIHLAHHILALLDLLLGVSNIVALALSLLGKLAEGLPR
eukprot:m.783748 g.783748  ORF g.783748 m.783748 type:complete len:307 (+) comp59154_c0_seq4:100-1020(+)